MKNKQMLMEALKTEPGYKLACNEAQFYLKQAIKLSPASCELAARNARHLAYLRENRHEE